MNKKLIVEVFKSTGLKELMAAKNVPSGMMLVEGVLGRVDSENRNKRYYPREEYAKHIKLMQERISESNGILGEMEHPKSMNIDLNKVSHKVVEIRLDEDGFVRGNVLLLDTPAGKIAQSIVRSGSPLPISSRAVGQVSESGEVKLDLLSTFDLVGTAGFAEARLSAALMESVDENGKVITETYTYEIDSNGDVIAEAQIESIVEAVEARLRKNYVHKDDVQAVIESQVATKLESVNEGLADGKTGMSKEQVLALMNEQFVDLYSPILENWITTQFAPEMGETIQEWVSNDFSNVLEQWIKEDVLPHNGAIVEKWIKEDVLPHNAEVTESWLKNTLLPHNADVFENWIKEDAFPKLGEAIQEWLVGDYANVIESWVDGKLDSKSILENKEDADVKADDTKEDKEEVDEANDEAKTAKDAKPTSIKEQHEIRADLFASQLLESVNQKVEDAEKIEEPKKDPKKIDEAFYQAAPTWLRRIPSEFKPMWQTLNESQRDQVYKRAAVRLLESDDSVRVFWKGIDFETIIESGTKSFKRDTHQTIVENADEVVKVNPRQGIGNFAKNLQKAKF